MNEQWVSNKKLNYRHVNGWNNQSQRTGENRDWLPWAGVHILECCLRVFQSFIPVLHTHPVCNSPWHWADHQVHLNAGSWGTLDTVFLIWNASLLLSNHLTPAPFFKAYSFHKTSFLSKATVLIRLFTEFTSSQFNSQLLPWTFPSLSHWYVFFSQKHHKLIGLGSPGPDMPECFDWFSPFDQAQLWTVNWIQKWARIV